MGNTRFLDMLKFIECLKALSNWAPVPMSRSMNVFLTGRFLVASVSIAMILPSLWSRHMKKQWEYVTCRHLLFSKKRLQADRKGSWNKNVHFHWSFPNLRSMRRRSRLYSQRKWLACAWNALVLSESSRIFSMRFSWSQVAPCALHLSFSSSVNTLKFRRQVALAHWYLGNTEDIKYDIAIVVTLSYPMPHAPCLVALIPLCWKFEPTEHRNQALIERSHLLKPNLSWKMLFQSHRTLRSNESHLRSTMENPWNSGLYAWKP